MSNRIDRSIPGFLLSPRMRPWRHLLLQVLVILIAINVLWDTPDRFILNPVRILACFVYWCVLNSTIYLNLKVLTPRLLMRNRLFLYLLAVVGVIVLFIVTISMLESLFAFSASVEQARPVMPVWLNLLSSVVTIGLLLFGTSALRLFREWLAESLRVGELESETLRSELGLLKSQINPHFLFNMLNNAYLLLRKQRPEAQEVIFKLEDLLRYQLNDSAREEVRLSSDIRFLSDFLNLEKVRRDQFEFTISKEGNIHNVVLPPLLFIPFVENAVKHNNDSENASYVDLLFRLTGRRLEFRCVNSKPPVPAARGEVGGIGLANIRRRLELLFPARHILDITETELTYTVDLQLEL